jgi:hypothetical protein
MNPQELIGQQWIGRYGITREVIDVVTLDGQPRLAVWTHGGSRNIFDLWPPERFAGWKAHEEFDGKAHVDRVAREAAKAAQAAEFNESIRWYTDGMTALQAGKVAKTLRAPADFVIWSGCEAQSSGEYLQRMAATGWRPHLTDSGKYAAISPAGSYVELGKIRHAYLVALVARLQSSATVAQ